MNNEHLHFGHRMSDADALLWSVERDPALRSTITSVYVFDGPLDRDRLRQRMERLSRKIPPLRQRVRTSAVSLAPPRWETDPNFDLDYHLWWVGAPGTGTTHDLMSLAESVAMSGFDRARPLWRAMVVEGLEQDRSAIVFKVHHSITDGLRAVQIQLELLDFEPDADRGPMPPEPEVHVLNPLERFADAFQHESRRQLRALQQSAPGLFRTARNALTDPGTAIDDAVDLLTSVSRAVAPGGYPLSPLMVDRSLSMRFATLTFPLAVLRSRAKAEGVTVNDVYLTAVTRGVRRYHLEHRVDIDELRVAMPISLRSDTGDQSANAFVPARFVVGVDFGTVSEALADTHERALAARNERALRMMEPAANILSHFPKSAVALLFGTAARSVDFAASNVPGSPEPFYLAGARLLSQTPFGPLGGAALNITLLSYEGETHWGIVMDPAAIPDRDTFLTAFEAGVREVLDGDARPPQQARRPRRTPARPAG